MCKNIEDTTCYGDYFQWGREADGHQDLNNTAANFILGKATYSYDWTNEDQDGSSRAEYLKKFDGTGICPQGYRVPTGFEFYKELKNYTKYTAYSNTIRIPLAGKRSAINAEVQHDGKYAELWTTNPLTTRADALRMDKNYANSTTQELRATGASIKCIEQNSSPVASAVIINTQENNITVFSLDATASFDIDDTKVSSYKWSIKYAPIDSNATIQNSTSEIATFKPDTKGGYVFTLKVEDKGHLSDQHIAGLTYMLNISADAPYQKIVSLQTGRIWLDRNLGSTKACDTQEDTECYGDFYQWGRGKDGHEQQDSPTTDKLIAAYDENSTLFILSNEENQYDWMINEPENATDAPDADGAKRAAFLKLTDGSGVCPVNFRVPTGFEFYKEFKDYDRDETFTDTLMIPLAGHRSGLNGDYKHQGEWTKLWTDTFLEHKGDMLRMRPNFINTITKKEASNGVPIRCIEDIN